MYCPRCRQTMTVTASCGHYECSRHGTFEFLSDTEELIHVESRRHWQRWDDEWYQQHTHPDEIRFEIHASLDKLYTQGYRATKVIIARRYQKLISGYLENSTPWRSAQSEPTQPRLWGIPVEFSPDSTEDPRWSVINFDLEKEPGVPVRYPYFRLFE
jgi:uncharacterized protein (TIGR02652 family)